MSAAPRRKPAPKKKKRKTRKYRLQPWWIAAFLGLVLLVQLGISLAPYLKYRRNLEHGAAVPAGYRHFVVDISHYNPREVVWDSLRVMLRPGGITARHLHEAKEVYPPSHVVMKATEGEKSRDAHFAQWWEQAGEAGISRGAYHFYRTSKDPLRQAAHYIRTVQLTHRDLAPVLDIETTHSGLDREKLNRDLLVWLQEIEKHYGRRPIVYTGDSFAQDWLLPEIKEHYPLWIARYNTQPPRCKGWKYWQFTDGAVIYGIKGLVDLSVICEK